MRTLLLTSIVTLCIACQPKSPETKTDRSASYRPSFHFTPQQNWTNDPNGLVYLDGEYHLYYQYNPYANVWGHMSWGHAVSKDLLHWTHLPVALEEYTDAKGDSVMIFSGSAVVDQNNTSGFFGTDSTGIVAIYTSHVHKNNEGLQQHQSIAYSKDKGRTFTRYASNPVVDRQRKDFRDPKVFWYEPEKKWIMAAVVPDRFITEFYGSADLKTWTLLSEFGPLGDTMKIWECPDLLEVPVLGEVGKKKWVLLISNSHPQGPTFVGMQYFVGNFDGKVFTPENPGQYPLYLDYGKDFYAAVTYNNLPAEQESPILLGWANNWAYGQSIPTNPWRSAMTLPRELFLTLTPEGYRIIQRPIKAAESLKGDELKDLTAITERSLLLEYDLTSTSNASSGLKIFKQGAEETTISYDPIKKEVVFDRTVSGDVSFHADFSSVERAPATLKDGKLRLTIFIDHSIVEVFINGGEQVITDQVFPTSDSFSIETFKGSEGDVISLKVWKVKL
jgi:fructan beta-fructosidase